MDRFTISATAHWPNYLPEYVARDLGYFADEDIEVATSVPDPWTRVLDDLDAGRADAVLGGVWVPAMYRGRGRDYGVFAQLNARFPMAVVTRERFAEFRWKVLEGRTILVPGAGGAAPYLFLSGVMRESGTDTSSITFVHDLSGDMFAELYAGGTGDAILTDMLTAARLRDSGTGHVAVRLDEAGGPMPNSVYYTRREVLDREDAVAERFTAALQRAMDWLQAHDAADVDDLLRAEWPEHDSATLVDVVEGFRRSGLWADTVRVDEQALGRWQGMLVAGGLMTAPVPYADLIDPRAAQHALAVRGLERQASE